MRGDVCAGGFVQLSLGHRFSCARAPGTFQFQWVSVVCSTRNQALQGPRVQRSALCKHLDKVFTGGDKTGIIFYEGRITYRSVTKLDKAIACGEGSS